MPIVYHKFTQKSNYFRGKSSRSINMSIINGLHGFNLGVIFLILTYFVSEVLLQKYNTCQPLPRPKFFHGLTRVSAYVSPKSWHGSCTGSTRVDTRGQL